MSVNNAGSSFQVVSGDTSSLEWEQGANNVFCPKIGGLVKRASFTSVSVKTHEKLYLLDFIIGHLTTKTRDTRYVADRVRPGRFRSWRVNVAGV